MRKLNNNEKFLFLLLFGVLFSLGSAAQGQSDNIPKYEFGEVFNLSDGEKFKLEGYGPKKFEFSTGTASPSIQESSEPRRKLILSGPYDYGVLWHPNNPPGFLASCNISQNGESTFIYFNGRGADISKLREGGNYVSSYCDGNNEKFYFFTDLGIIKTRFKFGIGFDQVNTTNQGILDRKLIIKDSDGNKLKEKQIEINMTNITLIDCGNKENCMLSVPDRDQTLGLEFEGDQTPDAKRVEVYFGNKLVDEQPVWPNWEQNQVPEQSDCYYNSHPRTSYSQKEPNRMLDPPFYAWQSCAISNQRYLDILTNSYGGLANPGKKLERDSSDAKEGSIFLGKHTVRISDKKGRTNVCNTGESRRVRIGWNQNFDRPQEIDNTTVEVPKNGCVNVTTSSNSYSGSKDIITTVNPQDWSKKTTPPQFDGELAEGKLSKDYPREGKGFDDGDDSKGEDENKPYSFSVDDKILKASTSFYLINSCYNAKSKVQRASGKIRIVLYTDFTYQTTGEGRDTSRGCSGSAGEKEVEATVDASNYYGDTKVEIVIAPENGNRKTFTETVNLGVPKVELGQKINLSTGNFPTVIDIKGKSTVKFTRTYITTEGEGISFKEPQYGDISKNVDLGSTSKNWIDNYQISYCERSYDDVRNVATLAFTKKGLSNAEACSQTTYFSKRSSDEGDEDEVDSDIIDIKATSDQITISAMVTLPNSCYRVQKESSLAGPTLNVRMKVVKSGGKGPCRSVAIPRQVKIQKNVAPGNYTVDAILEKENGEEHKEVKSVTIESTEEDTEGEPDLILGKDKVDQGETVRIEAENLANHSIEVKDPQGNVLEEFDTEEGSSFTYTLSSNAAPGEYKVKAIKQAEAGFLSNLATGISNAIVGPTVKESFTVRAEKAEWVSYCSSEGYQIDSISQDIGNAEDCIENQIVPTYFETSSPPSDTDVPENLCNDLLDYKYSSDKTKCVPKGE